MQGAVYCTYPKPRGWEGTYRLPEAQLDLISIQDRVKYQRSKRDQHHYPTAPAKPCGPAWSYYPGIIHTGYHAWAAG